MNPSEKIYGKQLRKTEREREREYSVTHNAFFLLANFEREKKLKKNRERSRFMDMYFFSSSAIYI